MVEIDMLRQALQQGEKRIEALEKKDREREEKFMKLSLGTRGSIPSGYMLNTLWAQTIFDHNVPSG
jgi:hypothetical protein